MNEAIKIGNYMIDHQIDLEVSEKCFSSCMNYLAPSAKHFIVNQHSILMMHGGMTPKTDDWLLDYVYSFNNGEISSNDLIKFIKEQFESLKNEEDLYKKTGINIDIISKSSEVARKKGRYWLLTLDDLRKFGYENIVDHGFLSDKNYLKYLKRIGGKDRDKFTLDHSSYSQN